MIDYEELDERIRRIVRQELGRPKPRVVESLVGVNAGTAYTDRYGDRWEYHSNLLWEDTSSGNTYPPDETYEYGPFTEVVIE